MNSTTEASPYDNVEAWVNAYEDGRISHEFAVQQIQKQILVTPGGAAHLLRTWHTASAEFNTRR